MKRIALATTALLGSLAVSAPANAWFTHTHYCNCGHPAGAGMCGGSTSSTSTTSSTSGGSTTSSTSGGSTTSSTSGGSTTSSTSGGSTTSSTSGGSTTSSSTGGTAVPEPGMLGLMGLGFIGLAAARRRRR